MNNCLELPDGKKLKWRYNENHNKIEIAYQLDGKYHYTMMDSMAFPFDEFLKSLGYKQ